MRSVRRRRHLPQRLQKIATQIPGMVYVYKLHPDGSSCFPYASPGIRTIYRLEPEDVRTDAAKLFDLIDPDDYAGVVTSIQQSAQTLSPWHHTYRVRFADGTVRWVEGHATPERDPDGSVVWHGYLSDVTEHIQAYESLRESEYRYRTLFETMTQGVVYQAMDGSIIAANLSAERILGLSLDQLQGRTSLDPRWHAIHEDGTPFTGETHPAMVALHTGQPVRDVVMGIYNAQREDYVWILVNAIPQTRPGDSAPYQVYTTLKDITVRRQSEQALFASEAQYRMLAENIRDVVWVVDSDGRFTYISPSVFHLRGYTAAEAIQQALPDMLTPESLQVLLDHMHQPVPTSGYVNLELVCKSGATVWTECVITPIIERAGMLTSWMGVSRDITERKRAEEQASRWHRVFEMAEFGLAYASVTDNTFLDVNPAFARQRGYRPDELVGRSVLDISMPEERAAMQQRLSEMDQTGHLVYETIHQRKDGTPMPVLMEVTVITDARGKPISRVAYALDITERTYAQQALQQANAERDRVLRFNEALLDAIPIPIIFKDCTGHYLGCNKIFSDLVGKTADDLRGKTTQEVWPADVSMRLQAHDDEVLRTGCPHTYETQVRDMHGTVRDVMFVKNVFRDEMGAIAGLISASVDITERKQAETALTRHRQQLEDLVAERTEDLKQTNLLLEQSTMRLKLATESAGIGVWEWNIREDVQLWDTYMAMLYGLPPGTAPKTYQDWLQRVHPDDRAVVMANSEGILQGHQTYATNFRIVWPDGTIRHIAAYGRLNADAANPYLVGVNWDITDQKEAEHNLAQYQRYLETLVTELESANHRLRMSDRRLQMLFNLSQQVTNLGESDLLRLGIDEAVHLTGSTVGHFHFIHADQETIELATWSSATVRQCTTDALSHYPISRAGIWAECVHTGCPVVYNDFQQPADHAGYPAGHVILDRYLGVPIIENGAVCMVIGVGNKPTAYDETDIRELQLLGNDLWRMVMRRRTEEALRESEAHYRTLFESSVDALAILDIERGCFVDCNHATVTLYEATTREDFLSLPLTQLAAQSNVPSPGVFLSMQIQRAVATGNSIFEWTHQKQDGTLVTLMVSFSALHLRGRTQMLMIGRDISEIKRYHRDLERARDAAETSNRAKSTFLANMSHEIRTPLNAIVGLAHLLSASATTVQQRERLARVLDSAHLLLGIINDILDLSKIEAGKLTIATADFAVERLLNDISTMMTEKAVAKGVEFIYDVAADLPPILHGDLLHLSEVLLNFTSNAVKFTETGFILLRIRVITETDDDLVVQFAVQDTGIGIAPDQHQRVFEIFEQANSSTTSIYGGTGLGLAISKRLVQLMGGEIGMQSQLGQGSTFWFTVPLGKTSDSGPPYHLRPEWCGSRVLVVDDLVATGHVLHEMLTSMGLRVDTVASDDAALNAIQVAQRTGDPYSIVLLDDQMPELDHIAIAWRRHAPHHPHPPIMLIMTSSGPPMPCTSLRHGDGAVCLGKPIMPGRLFETLVALMQGDQREVSALLRTPPPTPLAHYRNVRILLAEDNRINQDVARDLLEEAGIVVDVAENGQVAIAMAQHTVYDLILMDIHMPMLDGLAATQAIRRIPGREQTPILALTANAFDEDRERCLQAGMNDYVAKPVEPAILFAALNTWIALPAMAANPAVSSPGSTDEDSVWQALTAIEGLDVTAGLNRVRGNRAVYKRLLRMYGTNHASDMIDLRDALHTGDRARARRIAHTLKGSAATLSAVQIQTLATDLEAALYEQQPDETIMRLVDAMDMEHAALAALIQQLLPDHNPADERMLDWNQVRTVMTHLRVLLADNDMEAQHVFWQSEALLIQAFGDVARQLRQQITAFAFEQALSTVQTLQAGLLAIPEVHAPAPTATILIIDDDPLVHQALETLLHPDGHRLEAVTTAGEGIARAAALQPDLILLDVMMPDMNGFEVCRCLRSDPILTDIPIVMITALADPDARIRGLNAGVDDFITKPFDWAELHARVRTIIRLNRYRRLQSERMRFAWILKHAQDGYLVIRPDDTVQYTNPQARAYLGLRDDDAIPVGSVLDLLQQQYQLYPETIWAAWPDLDASEAAYLVRPETAHAPAFWLQVHHYLPGDDHHLERVVQLRDVTEAMQAQVDIYTFQGGLSHKVRTPLQQIRGGLDLLRMYGDTLSPTEMADLIDIAWRGVQRLQHQIDDVVTYMSAATLIVPGVGCSLSTFSDRIYAISADLYIQDVTVTVPNVLQAAWLPLAPATLDLIVYEILENAQKFHPQQSPIIEVLVVAGSNVCQIQIQDDGITLTPRQLAHALTPYRQGEKSFTGEVPGMGLGLPLVSALVWQIGGQVRLRNRLDQAGIIVDLTLPLRSQPDAS